MILHALFVCSVSPAPYEAHRRRVQAGARVRPRKKIAIGTEATFRQSALRACAPLGARSAPWLSRTPTEGRGWGRRPGVRPMEHPFRAATSFLSKASSTRLWRAAVRKRGAKAEPCLEDSNSSNSY